MKTLYVFIISSCFLFIFSECKDNPEVLPTPGSTNAAYKIEHSMKGWELYSWQVGEQRKYSILPGTNRLKTYEEVMSSNLMVTGENELKNLLTKFPEGEFITLIGQGWLSRCWQDKYYNIDLPPAAIIDKIKQYCNEVKITLYITD
jgi:hypothetical protein